MRQKTLLILLSLSLLLCHFSLLANRPQVEIKTNMGDIVVELALYRAPATVDNFLKYVKSGFYSNTVFHRVEQGFVIQGGGFDLNYEYKESDKMVRNESDNGLENKRGTIAMARTNDVHSANSQFYFNVSDNRTLDARYGRLGYTVFGKVLSGMEVVDSIANVDVGAIPLVGETVPVNPVVIRSINLIEPKQTKTEEKQ